MLIVSSVFIRRRCDRTLLPLAAGLLIIYIPRATLPSSVVPAPAFVELAQGHGGFGEPERGGLREIAAGRRQVIAADGQRTAGIDGLGRMARTVEVALGGVEIIAADGGVGGVEIGHAVGGEHADGGLEDLGEFVRARLTRLRDEVELVLTQLLRMLTHDAPYLVHVAEAAYGVGYAVVGVAQGRVAVVEQEAVVGRIAALDGGLACVRLHAAVDEPEDFLAVLQVRPVDISAQSGPVLRFEVGRDDAVGEVVELLDVVLQRRRSSAGEVTVVGVGAFRRGIALEPYGGDGDVAVGAHGVYRGLNLPQLDGVSPVVGIDLGLVDGEVDERRAFERVALLRLALRLDVDELGEEVAIVMADDSVGLGDERVATAVVLAVERKGSSLHPLFIRDEGVIGHGVGHLGGAHLRSVAAREHALAVAAVIVVAATAINSHRRQQQRVTAGDDARREEHGAVGADADVREPQVHVNGNVGSVAGGGQSVDIHPADAGLGHSRRGHRGEGCHQENGGMLDLLHRFSLLKQIY